MFVYHAGTLVFRAWVLEDVNNRPISVDAASAKLDIKRSADDLESIYSETAGDDVAGLTLFSDEDLPASWLEWRLSELDIAPGDYVLYVYLLTPEKQLVEQTHMLVLANSSVEEVAP